MQVSVSPEPIRGEDYFTVDGQYAVIKDLLERYEDGSTLPHVILDDSDRVIGRITLNGIVRGPFQSCSMGYWVGAAHNGRGFATAAVREIVRVAFEELGLHRVQAESVLHNVRSQPVLERNGFVRFGVAPAYLNIAGRWQDHAMYQVVNDALPHERGAIQRLCARIASCPTDRRIAVAAKPDYRHR